MINSPKIAKHIETGETKEIQRGDRELGRLLPDAVDEPVAHRAARQQADHVREGDGALDGPRGPVPQAPQALSPDRGEPARRPHGVRQRFFARSPSSWRSSGSTRSRRRSGGSASPRRTRRSTGTSAENQAQRRVIEGRDQVLERPRGGDRAAEVRQRARLQREYQQKIAQLNERIKELNQRVLIAEAAQGRPGRLLQEMSRRAMPRAVSSRAQRGISARSVIRLLSGRAGKGTVDSWPSRDP